MSPRIKSPVEARRFVQSLAFSAGGLWAPAPLENSGDGALLRPGRMGALGEREYGAEGGMPLGRTRKGAWGGRGYGADSEGSLGRARAHARTQKAT